MSSVVCCEGSGRRVSVLLLMLLLGLQLMLSCNAGRIHRSAFMDGDVRSEVVDPNNRTIWGMFNLTEEQVNRIRNGTNPSGKDETTQATRNRLLDHIALQRMNEIRSRIRIAVSNDNQNTQHEQDKPLHEMAGYPICNGETTTSEQWNQTNNLSLEFASSVFQQNRGSQMTVDSAILRLYKTNPKAQSATPAHEATSTSTSATEPLCPEPMLESQIRVTVSIVHQQKKKRKTERKKRTCNTMMLSTTKTGWVDIDVKCALNYWAQQQQTQSPIVVGVLLIEVHDDEENQLMPGLYFQPPSCEKADIAVPWPVYRSASTLRSVENSPVPKFPRLDVIYIGNGALSPKNFDSTNDVENFNLQKYIYGPNRSRESLNTEPTTLNSPTIDNMLENSESASQAKEHIHQHRRRHQHSQQQQPHQMTDCFDSSDSKDSSQQSETQHQLRTHHNQYHHNHHHHQHHNHHKHRHSAQSEE
ncbi:protein anachronism isoform X1 [Drosophila albomicans]|uniref:Protein anachronism isoform X1 n=2 Tax=Drosophila albomicans TaxID=7291 RepID=A0A6P8XAL5_DROAB|nr:protein anachronism isoform X1 [Drosophila albomicans]